MRINKYLSECGVCSRREADILIEAGRVQVNQRPAQPGMQVDGNDEVLVDGKKAVPAGEKEYLAFNKPRGIVCTAEKREKNNLIDYLKYPKRITYAGRLDKDSEGLLLLTDDGDLIDALMTGSNGHEKEYVVTVEGELTPERIQHLAAGVWLKEIGRQTAPCKVWQSGKQELHMVLTQGINRQIRRMCKNTGLYVRRLKRIRIGRIFLGDLPCGKLRRLTEEEKRWLEKIKQETGKSNLRSEKGKNGR